MSELTLRPIGAVRSPVRERKSMPSQGVPAAVEILPGYRDGLLRLEKHSHVWVLAWLDRAERNVLQVTPRGLPERGPEALHGVFAVRSPARPNSIGLSATRIVRVDGLRIEVDPLDFLDGTPVIDLKPYFVSRDLIFSANNAQIGRPASREALRESLLRQALNFHGEWCADVSRAVRILEHFRSEVLQLIEPERWRVTVPLGRPCIIDAVMGMTRATPGRGSLVFGGDDCVVFDQQAFSCSYRLSRGQETDAARLLAAPEAELFEFLRNR